MRQVLQMRPRADDIDTLVDEVLADPSRADEFKRILRGRLRTVEPSPRETADDELDLWDNVPV